MNAIAYSSPFVPPEWILAHGLRPHWLRLRATEGLTRGVCPYAGALMDAAIRGIDASALVLTTVCDQMRYVAALLENRSSCPVFLLNVPSMWQTAAVRQLYLDELRRLGRFLVRLEGKAPSSAALARVMLAYDRDRHERNSRELTAPGASALDFTAIPLAVLGGPLLDSDYGLFDIVEEAGGRVVLDATEGSERTMPRPFDPARLASDPLQELADAYFDGIPDAFRRPNSRLYEWLGRELAVRNVRAIILRRYLWCDLWHAELHRLRQWSKLPVLEIDVGPDDTGAPNRMQGRIEAFLEMLK
jgi:benzoyl-CoA reductase/2-hydroxyglutaryl-CoA dehydratase subunit BcrC/BadD/HgdB